MEQSDLEKQLGELEEKIDRVRALYEQYFMGIERLEPLTPRKEVDRRVVMLRKEQMRNTALRFRFNTLCQRFNTMQQHWGRITREIENGTYKRDVARAAARFGVEEAMTAVGRKRAASLQKVLERQGGDAKREQEAAREAARAREPAYDDDDAPTPPPPPGGLRPVAQAKVDTSKFAPPAADPGALAGYGYAPPAAYAPPKAAGDADLSALGFPSPPASPGAVVAPPAPPAPPVARRPSTAAVSPGFSPPTAPSGEPSAPAHVVATGASESGPESGVPRKPGGGLRLGGGGHRAADPDAARRRLQELAEKIGATPAAPPVAAAQPPARRFNPEDVITPAVPASVPPPPPPQRPAGAPMVRPPASDGPPSKPLGLRPPTAARASSPSFEGDATPATPAPLRQAPVAAPPPVASPAASAPATATDRAPIGPTAAERAEALRDNAAKAAVRRDEGLGESRVRQIYNELLDAKRKANESTASITFDKLHDSLKKQVDKLKKEHTDRRIDFAVVTKDGKAMIKPIIK